jgi:hypothetical protein
MGAKRNDFFSSHLKVLLFFRRQILKNLKNSKIQSSTCNYIHNFSLLERVQSAKTTRASIFFSCLEGGRGEKKKNRANFLCVSADVIQTLLALYIVYVCRNPLGSHFQWGMNVNCSKKEEY